ncbi:coiled-coil domain-containing protein 167-like [Watersipora subatra]|uniref:coiled-coil domain-containing protein 167-like n=1 Tax=Watersipora subatra TaxID=2589382 RepID=UPI00355BCC4A
MPTIAQTIEREEKVLAGYSHELDGIEKKLRLKKLNDTQRSDLELERNQLLKKKAMTEKVVGKLRKENFKTMLFSLLLMAIGVVLYFGSQSFFSSS